MRLDARAAKFASAEMGARLDIAQQCGARAADVDNLRGAPVRGRQRA